MPNIIDILERLFYYLGHRRKIVIKPVHSIEYPILSELAKEDLEKVKTTGEEITIEVDTTEFGSSEQVLGNVFVKIQKIQRIGGNRWVAKGQSFSGLHDVLIFSGTGEDKFFAKTLKILRGGLKAAL